MPRTGPGTVDAVLSKRAESLPLWDAQASHRATLSLGEDSLWAGVFRARAEVNGGTQVPPGLPKKLGCLNSQKTWIFRRTVQRFSCTVVFPQSHGEETSFKDSKIIF